jgi:hypothetical protein
MKLNKYCDVHVHFPFSYLLEVSFIMYLHCSLFDVRNKSTIKIFGNFTNSLSLK